MNSVLISLIAISTIGLANDFTIEETKLINKQINIAVTKKFTRQYLKQIELRAASKYLLVKVGDEFTAKSGGRNFTGTVHNISSLNVRIGDHLINKRDYPTYYFDKIINDRMRKAYVSKYYHQAMNSYKQRATIYYKKKTLAKRPASEQPKQLAEQPKQLAEQKIIEPNIKRHGGELGIVTVKPTIGATEKIMEQSYGAPSFGLFGAMAHTYTQWSKDRSTMLAINVIYFKGVAHRVVYKIADGRTARWQRWEDSSAKLFRDINMPGNEWRIIEKNKTWTTKTKTGVLIICKNYGRTLDIQTGIWLERIKRFTDQKTKKHPQMIERSKYAMANTKRGKKTRKQYSKAIDDSIKYSNELSKFNEMYYDIKCHCKYCKK